MNPFKYGSVVTGKFFTDREEELQQVKMKLDSENHLVLISPRRFGKSSLVEMALQSIPRDHILIDMQYVIDVDDLAAHIVKSILDLHTWEKIKHLMSHFRVAPTLTTNALTGSIEVSFQPTVSSAALLEDAMALIDKVSTTENRLIVVFDEFQEILNIGKGLDKQLRSLMQRQKNLNYILMGSQESMMEDIFEKKASPFYHFGYVMHLHKIPREKFEEYLDERLPDVEEKVEIIQEILDFTRCHPYYTQLLASEVWEKILYSHIHENVVNVAKESIVSARDLDFERLWLAQNRTDRSILLQIAKEHETIKSKLQPKSTRYSALRKLQKAGLLIKVENFELEDPFFRVWMLKNIETK